MKYILFLSGIFFILLLSTGNSLAFRCGNEVVSRGDEASSAQSKCGNPVQYGSGLEYIEGTMQNVTKEFYNCGEHDFLYSISIFEGKIVQIDTVERGTGEGQCH
jgi:hypothetical protein